MKKQIKILITISIILFCLLNSTFSILHSPVYADEIEDIVRQIQELEKARQQSENATKPLESEVIRLREKLAGIQKSLKYISANIIALERSIKERESDFDRQYEVLSIRVGDYYKQLRMPSDLFIIFSQSSLSDITKQIAYRRSVSDEDKNIISQISKDLIQLDADRQKVENDKKTLQQLQATVAEQSEFFEGEIKGAKAYQEELGKKITELSAKQKELLAKKTATFQTSVGSVPSSGDPASRADFNPGFSPAFAMFSFGAPHFKGMSQYGALGRAKEGSSYEEILKAYYGDVRIESVDTNFDLPTTEGNKNLEDNYLKGLAEMPASWADEGGFEALKAQAIAGRSYALSYTGWRMGDRSTKKPICTSESCQVYNSGKAANPGRWGDAVNDTKGKILVSNQTNEIVNAWYASTSGGYQESYSALGHSTPGFWDAKGGRNGWTSDAYEKIGGSPWFYKGWYKTRSGTTCGRSHPWLTQEEMADIVNAVIVYQADNGAQSHLSQEDSSCYGDSIPDTWDKNKLRQEADDKGGSISSISGVSVTYSEDGTTTQVSFNTNRGTVSFSGSDFYKIFNLRAPGALHLTSGLFNVEKK